MSRRPVPPAALAVLFGLLVAVMTAHQAEHVAQVLQKNALDASCPNDCRGLLGFVFDLEWIHFAYNVSIGLALLGLLVAFQLWRNPWMTAAVALQGYHVVEHIAKLVQWFVNGRRSPTPGFLGRDLSLVELHFAMNTIVFLLAVAAFFTLRLHRRLFDLRTPSRLALAAALLVVTLVGSAWVFEQRPPTIRLAAGVHQGPIVIDRPSRLVGQPGTIVRGGIRIRSDDVVVRDVAVVDAENGIDVDGAENVVLQGVRVSRFELDGIRVRRGVVTVRKCTVDGRGREWTQGIDISFTYDLPPSSVVGCRFVGGWEGIVTHSAKVMLARNHVTGTRLRAIDVTEMSMGKIERNRVTNALGVGIFCGDHSMCEIEDNEVVGTRPDRKSSDATRLGYGIQVHWNSHAELADNIIRGERRRPVAFFGGRIEND